MKRLSLLLISLAITAALLAILDRIALRKIADENEIPRFERQVTTTPEFHYTADINSSGYRNEEFTESNTGGEVRIVTIGDSFTYGWGVEESNSWPRILEQNLRSAGHKIRVLNLGKPGDSPHSYARTAYRMLPRLNPHLVIVAVLQGDDIAQLNKSTLSDIQKIPGDVDSLRTTQPGTVAPLSLKNKALRFFKALYPNAARIRNLRSRTQTTTISTIWQRQVQGLLDQATPEESARFDKLSEETRALYKSGGLNPSLLRLALSRPNYFSETWDTSSPFTQKSVEVLSGCLDTIRNTADLLHATSLVISIPYGMYCSQTDWENWHNVGFDLYPEMLTQDNADTVIRDAAQKAGIEFQSVLRPFRSETQNKVLYYTFDGHFNPEGHRVFARLLTEQITPAIRSLEEQLAAQ